MKRFSLLVLLLIVSIITLFLTTYFQRDINTLSLNDPQVIQASIILMVILFFPPFVLSFLNNSACRVISSIYQLIFLFGFVVLIPTGLLGFNAVLISIASLVGAGISIWSIIITLPKNFLKEK
ncbi:hypothetical protein J14TS2_07590 [Bacillus sp. J14TS2]|uniref:hypothetical protein n=1 Tax=Bacillus sp. J14TS2 TaxID=2807188 RepID=UPI001B0B3A93|nr:hypothetical protein [Bacillus sp. J14TS2]GIN70284.1 hypothetical protein J14TS2_07590 [Bacillus sp. J14TS2]